MTVPSLSAAGPGGGGRARALPAPLRAGADVGLLVIAAVAYWQLDRPDVRFGPLSSDPSGTLGIDPLLVSAPALALLAGTVLTLRLLPPAASSRSGARPAGAGCRRRSRAGSSAAARCAAPGPVLLLVLAVAMGMLAIGQGASWNRSQDDQADFRAGTSVRVLAPGEAGSARPGSTRRLPAYGTRSRRAHDDAPDRKPGSDAPGPRHGGLATDDLLLRGDLAEEPVGRLLAAADRRRPLARRRAAEGEYAAGAGAADPGGGRAGEEGLGQRRAPRDRRLPLCA